MIGSSHIPYCYGHLVVMVPKRYIKNSFVLGSIGFIFDMEVP